MKLFQYFLLSTLTVALATPTIAQKKKKLPREVHYESTPFENEYVLVEILGEHSQMSFTQFWIKVTNKSSDDYILMKRQNVLLSSDEGDYGTKRDVKEKTVHIEPKGDIMRWWKIEGGNEYRVDNIVMSFEDAFFRVPIEAKKIEGGDFLMPPEVKSKMIEPFSVSLKGWSYSPKKLSADFKIKYRGEGVGIVDEKSIKVKLPDGSIVDNEKSDKASVVIAPLSSSYSNVSLSFSKGALKKNDPLHIIWDDALKTADPIPMVVDDIHLTNKKN